MIKWVYYFILFLFTWFLVIYAFDNVIFFGSQAKKIDLSSSLSLILSSSLAWLINQAKSSQAQTFWHSYSSSSIIVFKFVSNSSQTWVFDFYWRAKLKHTLLNNAWLIYSPTCPTNPWQWMLSQISRFWSMIEVNTSPTPHYG